MDTLNAQIYCLQQAFNAFSKVLELSSFDDEPQDSETLPSWLALVQDLLQQAAHLMNLSSAIVLPKATLFSICRCLGFVVRPQYTLATSMVPRNAIELAAINFCDDFLIPFIQATLQRATSPSSSNTLISISGVLQLLLSSFKLLQDDENQPLLALRLARSFSPGAPLNEPFVAFQRALVHQSDPNYFSTLMPMAISLVKHSIRSPFFECSISLPQDIILPSMIDEDDSIRDLFVCRKILSCLGLEHDQNGLKTTNQSCPRSKANYLSLACRVIPIVFESIAPRSKLSNEIPAPSLVSPSYRTSESPNHSNQRDLEALQRTVVVYTLKVSGSILDTLAVEEEKALEGLISLTRIVAAKGLFSLNPTSSFFHIFGDHDPQLLEALYWLQMILSRIQTHSSSPLVRELFAKIPPLAPFSSVLNPYTLFSDFLSFLQHDHSVLIDFMLSSESEKFLRYLLGFVKICLADWNQAFFTLYNLKRKKPQGQEGGSKALSSQDVDDLLERLLTKMSLEPTTEEGEEEDSEIEDDEEDDYSDPETGGIDSMLQSNADYETEFDATISTLIRLRVHLEHAVEKKLLTYNVQPLMSRLLEIETKYERQGEEE